jgi:hypothetical protein
MKRGLWLIPLLAAGVAYAPAPWADLVWDDPVFLDFQLRHFDSLRDVLVPPDDITRWSYAYYRPLVVLSYLLDAWLFGPGAAAGPHVANVIYHMTTTAGVALLLHRLLHHLPGSEAGALAGATVFAVHPLHTESVSWIAGRSDVLATMFLVPALLLALRWRDRRSVPALLLAPVLYWLALLGKEVAITGLALLPLILVLAHGQVTAAVPAAGPGDVAAPAPARAQPSGRTLASLAIVIAFLGAAAVYFWLRQRASMPALEYQPLTFTERGWRILQGTAYYLVKALVPWQQSAIVTWQMVPGRLVSAATVGTAALCAVWSAVRWRRGEGTPLLALSWFTATIALAIWTSVGPITNTPLAERHLYLPSIGVVLGLGYAISVAWTQSWRTMAGALVALLIVLYAAAALNRGLIWRTDYTLWADATRKARTDGLAWINYGLAQWMRGELEPALASFRQGLEDEGLEAKFQARAHNGIGMIAAAKGDVALAEASFRQAIATHPEFVEPYYRVACLYIARATRLRTEGRIAESDRAAEQAISNLATATARFPDYHTARLKLAGFLLQQGEAVAAEGDSARAARRFQAALDQLDTLAKRAAADPVKGRLEKAISEAQVAPDELRRRLLAHLASS